MGNQSKNIFEHSIVTKFFILTECQIPQDVIVYIFRILDVITNFKKIITCQRNLYTLLLGKSFPYEKNPVTDDKEVATHIATVLDLVLKLYYDVEFKHKVHAKMVEFTSVTKYYLSGIQLMPNHFYEFLSKLYLFINDYNEDVEVDADAETDAETDADVDVVNMADENVTISGIKYKEKLFGNIIAFSIHKKAYEVSDIWYTDIVLTETAECIATHPGAYYDYKSILFDSVPNANTIHKLGEDGYVAALLIFFHWNIIDVPKKTPDQIEAEKWAQLVNETKEAETCSLDEVPVSIISNRDFKMNLTEKLQKKLFNEYDDGEGFIQYFDGETMIKRTWYQVVWGKVCVKSTKTGDEPTKYYVYNKDLEVIDITEAEESEGETSEEESNEGAHTILHFAKM